MNSEKQVDFILEVFHRVKAHMEQERMGPAGTPSSVLLAEERSGSDSKRPLTDASGSPLPDQGGGEVKTIAARLEEEAAHAENIRQWLIDQGNSPDQRRLNTCLVRAAAFRRAASLLSEDPAEPLTQSAVDGVEEARCPKNPDGYAECEIIGQTISPPCPMCPRWGKREERSESGNEKG